jgi:hypothetical protein
MFACTSLKESNEISWCLHSPTYCDVLAATEKWCKSLQLCFESGGILWFWSLNLLGFLVLLKELLTPFSIVVRSIRHSYGDLLTFIWSSWRCKTWDGAVSLGNRWFEECYLVLTFTARIAAVKNLITAYKLILFRVSCLRCRRRWSRFVSVQHSLNLVDRVNLHFFLKLCRTCCTYNRKYDRRWVWCWFSGWMLFQRNVLIILKIDCFVG